MYPGTIVPVSIFCFKILKLYDVIVQLWKAYRVQAGTGTWLKKLCRYLGIAQWNCRKTTRCKCTKSVGSYRFVHTGHNCIRVHGRYLPGVNVQPVLRYRVPVPGYPGTGTQVGTYRLPWYVLCNTVFDKVRGYPMTIQKILYCKKCFVKKTLSSLPFWRVSLPRYFGIVPTGVVILIPTLGSNICIS